MNSLHERSIAHLGRCATRLPSSTAPDRVIAKFSRFTPSRFTDAEVKSFVQAEFAEAASKGGSVYRGADGRLRQKAGGGSRILPEGGAE